MSTLVFVMSSTAHANYCAAIRGNGELMPAHWGAMSSLVEEQGMPSAMAGGSSASITMFLLESISLNSQLQNNSEKALMIKSFQGYFETLSQTAEGKAIQSILADKAALQAIIASAGKIDQALKNPENAVLLGKHLGSLKILMASKDLQEIINPEFVLYVQRASQLAEQNKPELAAALNYRSEQISMALKNFGNFNSETDKTLFFRPGLISFEKLGRLFGKMANFYAGYNNASLVGKQIEQKVRQFLDHCTPGSQNLSWRELNEQRPQCRQIIGSAILMYRSAETSDGKIQNRIDEMIGSHIPSFATTSVITGAAVKRYATLFNAYQTNEDPNFGDQLLMSQDELRFGYWGQKKDLQNIENIFSVKPEFKNDPKSQKFLSLGTSAWSQVLAMSPAEPGLSRIVTINQKQLSAGGWSDLHPTLILKAHGCENIIYLTRKGGESMFAQGVFKRLTNADGFNWNEWQGLSPEAKARKNAMGNASDTQSTWSQLYNMANSQSSMFRSYSNATQIKCTDWDHFDVKKDLAGLVEEAMHAPLINPPDCR